MQATSRRSNEDELRDLLEADKLQYIDGVLSRRRFFTNVQNDTLGATMLTLYVIPSETRDLLPDGIKEALSVVGSEEILH